MFFNSVPKRLSQLLKVCLITSSESIFGLENITCFTQIVLKQLQNHESHTQNILLRKPRDLQTFHSQIKRKDYVLLKTEEFPGLNRSHCNHCKMCGSHR